jgi:hypothetical protein
MITSIRANKTMFLLQASQHDPFVLMGQGLFNAGTASQKQHPPQINALIQCVNRCNLLVAKLHLNSVLNRSTI